MTDSSVTYVEKACAYLTRGTGELLVFDGPGHDGYQIPEGTIEPGETPRDAVTREVREESGLRALDSVRRVASDIWTRRSSPPKKYVRHFFRATVHEPRDAWTHVVRDGGAEDGSAFAFEWIRPSASAAFALDLDDYLHRLDERVCPSGVASADEASVSMSSSD